MDNYYKIVSIERLPQIDDSIQIVVKTEVENLSTKIILPKLILAWWNIPNVKEDQYRILEKLAPYVIDFQYSNFEENKDFVFNTDRPDLYSTVDSTVKYLVEHSGLVRIIVPPEDRITSEGFEIVKKVRLTSSNKQWVFHKTDADNWPSVPHGHYKNEVLDIYAGLVYNKSTKQYLYTFGKKQISKVQKELSEKKDFKHLKFE